MLWWDWTDRQKWTFLAAMLGGTALFGLLLGAVTREWLGSFAVAALLLFPQLIGWSLFVGLHTGRIPIRHGSESRTDEPVWFWLTAAQYAALLLVFAWGAFVVATS